MLLKYYLKYTLTPSILTAILNNQKSFISTINIGEQKSKILQVSVQLNYSQNHQWVLPWLSLKSNTYIYLSVMVQTYKCQSVEYEMEMNGDRCLFCFNSANLEDALKCFRLKSLAFN